MAHVPIADGRLPASGRLNQTMALVRDAVFTGKQTVVRADPGDNGPDYGCQSSSGYFNRSELTSPEVGATHISTSVFNLPSVMLITHHLLSL